MGATPEKKERGLLAEINNGRLAMLGIMAFTAEQKIPGSVPALGQLGLKPYSGEFMAPLLRLQRRPAVRVRDARLHLAVVKQALGIRRCRCPVEGRAEGGGEHRTCVCCVCRRCCCSQVVVSPVAPSG